uniref:Uncharacterized protein n=1 Tax=Arundo donax TaxID=35708 RepID=A0A0A9CHI7_ARUDO
MQNNYHQVSMHQLSSPLVSIIIYCKPANQSRSIIIHPEASPIKFWCSDVI